MRIVDINEYGNEFHPKQDVELINSEALEKENQSLRFGFISIVLVITIVAAYYAFKDYDVENDENKK